MAGTGFAPFDFFYGYEVDLSTPVASPQRAGLAVPKPSAQEPPSSPLLYTITWMMRLRKGRLMKLTEDTIERELRIESRERSRREGA